MIGAHDFKFERLTPAEIDFEALDQFEDRLFSQRKCWLDFLTSFVWGEPIVAVRPGHRFLSTRSKFGQHAPLALQPIPMD